jgi:hypothetical protein
MMQVTVECLKFGTLVVKSTPYGAFEIIQLTSGNSGISIAQVEVEDADFPSLKISRLEPRQRVLNTRAAATVDRMMLASGRDALPSSFDLKVTGTDDHIELVLSGDCRHRLFWWRADFRVVNGEVIVHGPFLADDCYS